MRYIITSVLASQLATAALAEVPAVVTDIPPVHSLVAMVMGDLGQPVLLLDQGGDAHDFQLRPRQAGAIADADLVVWIGPEMSPWLDHVLESGATQGAVLGLLAAEGTFRQDYDAEGGHDHGGHDHAAEKAHDHGTKDVHDHTAAGGHDHEGHDHAGTDPHAWLDPHNAEAWVGLIAAELGRIDPANATTYAANAAAAAAQIDALEAEVEATLAPVKDRAFVVFHEAYGYFAGHFGLTIAGAVAEGDAASPGAARLRELQAAAEGRALCVFPEANHDPALSAQLAEATGTRLGGALDPEGAGLEPGAGLYPALLTGLAQTLADCLSQG
jgi:zinc transport system substrate-binding protein